MSTFTVNYKDPASTAPKTSYIVDGSGAFRDTTKADGSGFTIFYKDQVANDAVIAPKNTVVLDAGGAQDPVLPQMGIGRGNASAGCDTIQIRRDTLENWATHNPILAAGEFGHVVGEQDLRIGDGFTEFLDLPNLLESGLYRASLVGNCVVIYAATHGQGHQPSNIEVRNASSGEVVSVVVSVDSLGTVEIASSHDLVGHEIIIRA